MPDLLITVTAIAAGLTGGFFIGRRTSVDTVRARALEAELEDVRKEQEIAFAELEAAKHEWKHVQSELETYRREVVDHFSGTSEMLRGLTLQYRNVYAHLSEGAKLLCPEGSVRIDAGAEVPALSPETEASEPALES